MEPEKDIVIFECGHFLCIDCFPTYTQKCGLCKTDIGNNVAAVAFCPELFLMCSKYEVNCINYYNSYEIDGIVDEGYETNVVFYEKELL